MNTRKAEKKRMPKHFSAKKLVTKQTMKTATYQQL